MRKMRSVIFNSYGVIFPGGHGLPARGTFRPCICRHSRTKSRGALASPVRDALCWLCRGAAARPGRPERTEHGRSCENESGFGLRRRQVSPESGGCGDLDHRGHGRGDSETRVSNPGGCAAKRPRLLRDQRPQLQLCRCPGIVNARGLQRAHSLPAGWPSRQRQHFRRSLCGNGIPGRYRSDRAH